MKATDIIRVTKAFTFDMAHALFGYDGPCKNIHGHTYRLLVTLKGAVLQDQGNPKDGMLLDFGLLKTIVNKQVVDVYDHALVLNQNLPDEQKAAILQTTEKLHFVSYQPTCENLLIAIKNNLCAAFEQVGFELVEVRLDETPSAFAIWCKRDN